MTKAWKVLKKVVECSIGFLFVPAALFLVIKKKKTRTRIGYFIIDRIGHFAFDVELYLTQKQDKAPAQSNDIFFLEGKPCNDQLLKMAKRHIQIRWSARYLHKALCWIPGSDTLILPPDRMTNGSRDKDGDLVKHRPQLAFLPKEDDLGQLYLEKNGIRQGDKFVCLVVRDSAYLKMLDNRNWDYHAYRDSPIGDYVDCALALANRGYTVFRMGKKVNEAFEVAHPGVVDYATSSDRCDFLDIWLMANCHFCISTATGLDYVALVFRRPIVFVDMLPLSDMLSWHSHIAVPKYLYWRADNQHLSLKEHLNHSYHSSELYDRAGIGIRNLDPTEIRKAALEMDDRLGGKWIDTKHAMTLQLKFWDTMKGWKQYPEYHRWINPESRIGSEFLSASHPWFLSDRS